MTTVLMFVVWPMSVLNMTHVTSTLDPVNSFLVAVAVTVFSLRYRSRKKIENSNRKTLSI